MPCKREQVAMFAKPRIPRQPYHAFTPIPLVVRRGGGVGFPLPVKPRVPVRFSPRSSFVPAIEWAGEGEGAEPA